MRNDIFQSMHEQMEPEQDVLNKLHDKLDKQRVKKVSLRWRPLVVTLSFCLVGVFGVMMFSELEISFPSISVDAKFDYKSLFEMGETVLGDSAVSESNDIVGEAFWSRLVPIGNFMAEYEIRKVNENQVEQLKTEIGETLIVTDNQVIHTLVSRDDLVYLIIEEDNAFYVGRFFTAFPAYEQSFSFGEIFSMIYNVSSVNDVSSVVFEKSLIDNTFAGQRVEVPTVVIEDKEKLKQLYEMFATLESIDYEIRLEQMTETGTVWDVDTGNGEVAQLMRQVTLQFESGETVQFSFDPIAREFYQGGFGFYRKLDEERTNWLIELAQIDMILEENEWVNPPAHEGMMGSDLPFFGGLYLNNENQLVIQMTEVSEEHIEKVIQSLGHDQFIIEEVQYTQQELDEMMDYINEVMINQGALGRIKTSSWWLDTINNQIVITLDEYSQEQIQLFRELVTDSPMVEFEEGFGSVILE